jgi:flagellar L-ring protein precursor FlgH
MTSVDALIRHAARAATLVLAAAALAGCNALTRLSQIGEEPPLTKLESPAVLHDSQPISMPMPPPEVIERQPNSLWRPGSRAFLKDQRANQVGDILTVVIAIDDGAQISNTTQRSRTNAENASASSFLGYEASLGAVLPEAIDPTNLVDLDSSTSSQGAGSVNRDESIDLRVAALVTQVLPNGNLVIAGRQEVRVNYEVRELQVVGMIRPGDITSTNTISYDQIAEARIAYGGRGHISDVQQPRYGQQVFDVIWPF